MKNLSKEIIQEHLLTELQSQAQDSKVFVQENSFGGLILQIVTSIFENRAWTEREALIDNLLEPLNLDLGQSPIFDYTLLTPSEKAQEPPPTIQLPLWSDVLEAPDLDPSFSPDGVSFDRDDENSGASIVAFYSFKGGVGRSTALGLVGISLASRNRRVVMIDFDLEAPGLSILFQPNLWQDNGKNQVGVIDYLHQRYLNPDENIPSIEDCIQSINISGRGELFLIPAGEYTENYVHRLAQLDRIAWQSFYKGTKNPIHQLIEDIKQHLNPDVILIDARPGFNDTGAIALLDLADTGIICFSPSDQSFNGLRWVIQAARKQHSYKNKPDLRFLLTPMPVVEEDQLNIWLAKVENWIEENWGLPDDITVKEIYYKISYNPKITTLSNLVEVSKTLLNDSLINDYWPIVDTIDAGLPDLKPILPITYNRSPILNELHFESATAQELSPEAIPDIFQKTEDFVQLIRLRTWLIQGAKGTGKSILFRLFVEQPEPAKALASLDQDLSRCQFIPAHGKSSLKPSILGPESLTSYEQQVGENHWGDFWINYAILQLWASLEEVKNFLPIASDLPSLSSHSAIVNWLVKQAQSPHSAPQAIDGLSQIDQWLRSQNRSVWLLYDELDTGFGFGEESYARRKRALEALLAWWLESGASLGSITPKIFLREDIWRRLNFENKGHYSSKTLLLKWEEADLWRLILRQSLNKSLTFKNLLQERVNVTIDRLEILELSQLRKSLYPLWGERMGRGKKAFTYNWVRTRISDSNGNSFPRSLVLLLEQAVEQERKFDTEYSADIILRSKALTTAFPRVSEQRVDEVGNEYPELTELLSRLEGQRSPIDEDRLAQLWSADKSEVSGYVKDFVEAGIFQKRPRSGEDSQAYSVAELYLYGLGMTRKGQR
ncbi:MAG: AAA family ATPase [Cyanobacteria bacterium RI_101]|nr:AAA family ATPase [Cyanobacteria bacterium RI_101]